MKIKNSHKKFRDYFKKGNVSGVQAHDIFTKGKLKIVYFNGGVNIFWNDFKITQKQGLSVGVNTLGIWTDSSKSDFFIIEKGVDFFRSRMIFKELPLIQTWFVKIEDQGTIYWEINMEIEEWLHIDEFRILALVRPYYKNWFHNYQQEVFPSANIYWQDLCLDSSPSYLVGARFSRQGLELPSFSLEPSNGEFSPIVQSPPSSMDMHIVGLRKIECEEKRNYLPASYSLFTGRIKLYDNDELLDSKIEDLRRSHWKKTMGDKVKKQKTNGKFKVLLVNLPWDREGKSGVRAGSRWPHIKDESEGNYLPFPFFLAYAASLLRKNDIEVDLIDAIAQKFTKEKFIEEVLRRDFNILVIETSIPSFYYDMDFLRKLAAFKFPMVLCGANPQIYTAEFLSKNSFIDYVLFGEYEFTLLELIKALISGKKNLSSIRGLIWRNHRFDTVKNSQRTPFDINLLPWPYRESLPMEAYWDLPGSIPYPSVQMVASRGCPFCCNFCLWPQVLFGGKTYRTREIKDCVDEMESMIRGKGFKSVYFDDDTFNVGVKRMADFSDEVIKRGLNKVPWAVMAKADLMDENTLNKLKEAGLYAVKYGVESASQDLIDRCGKRLDLKKAKKIISYTKDLGIKVHLTFSFGLPGETKETTKKTIDYALSLSPESIQFSIVTPFPGTVLFEELDKQGRILTKDWSLYDGHHSCVFQPDGGLSSQDLEKAKRHAYLLWGEHIRRKRGFGGDIRRFRDYLRREGLRKTFLKTLSYLEFIWIKRKRYLSGKN